MVNLLVGHYSGSLMRVDGSCCLKQTWPIFEILDITEISNEIRHE